MNAIARRIIYLFKKIYSIKLEILLVEKKKLTYDLFELIFETEEGKGSTFGFVFSKTKAPKA